MKKLLVFGLLLATPALAQPPQQQTPSQVAIQVVNVINGWAQALEALQKQNADLQTQLASVTKERDELKTKLESKTSEK
jgi:septal ring factor EnvC (AmiA/AmiB activator)